MRYAILRHAITLAVGLVIAAPFGAQAQQKQPPQKGPPPPAAAKPYTPIAVKFPAPISDPSFEAFRKQVGEIAAKKDRAALAKLVVSQGFFWEARRAIRPTRRSRGSTISPPSLFLAARSRSAGISSRATPWTRAGPPFPESRA
jgi:hypothetical protein